MKTACLRACLVVMLFALSGSSVYSFTSEDITDISTSETPAAAASEKGNFFANILQKKYASMLNAVPQEITNTSLYSFIDEWYGVKYLWGGTTKDGIDCSALVQKMYEAVFNTSIVRTSMMQYGMVQPESKDSLKEGDLVFFNTRGNFISHVGVYLKNNFFVHSCSSKGVTISSLDENYWTKVYAAAGKISVFRNTGA